MRITISAASNDKVGKEYLEAAKHLLDYLVTLDNVELNWGSCSVSVMGECYKAFKKAGKVMHGYTTSKYKDDIDNLPDADHKIFNNTFDLKTGFFYDADIIICLAGGTGTVSEFFSDLEELRSNDQEKLLILYDENHHFDTTLNLIEDLINRNFNTNAIYDYFKVAHNVEEFKTIINEYNNNKKLTK